MYTLKVTKRVKGDRNLCDHIWVEEVFLTKIEVALKMFFTHLDKEQCILDGTTDGVVREYRKVG